MTALGGQALSHWPAVNLLQSLPRSVRPAHDETLESYLWRMAKANGMNPHYFFDYVKGSRKRKDPIPAETVITLSGQSPLSMRYAILELCSPKELAAMDVVGRPRPGFSIRGRECIWCASSRSIYEPVTCWKRSEDVICLPHRRWTRGIKQLDLTGHEDVIQANKQHRKLIRQYGRASVRGALAQASSILEEWNERRLYYKLVEQRMERFHGSGWRVDKDDPTLLASYNLPAVALARLLASPGWKALALDPAGNSAFIEEVRRTVQPRYVWDPFPYWRYVEPLARTLLEEREHKATITGLRRKFTVPEPPLAPSEVIGIEELCHDH